MSTESPSAKLKQPSAQPQGSPPNFLVDRSLQAELIAATCRDFGWEARTLRDVYGETEAQEVEDADWIARAGAENWDVLTNPNTVQLVREMW